MKALFLILFLFFIRLTIPAQNLADSNFINICNIKDSSLATKQINLFIDLYGTGISNSLHNVKFSPLPQFKSINYISLKYITTPLYLQVGILNCKAFDDSILLFPGIYYDKIIVYKQTTNNTLQYIIDASAKGICLLRTAANEKAVFIIKLICCRYDYNYLRPQLIKPKYLNTYNKVIYAKGDNLRILGFITSGMLFLLTLLIFINFIFTKKKEFLFYLFYAMSLFLLVFFLALLSNRAGSFASNFNGYFDFLLLVVSNIFYLAFTRHFLDTKKQYKVLNKTFIICEWFLILLLLIFSVLHFFTNLYFIERQLENLIKIFALVIGILFIVFSFKQKNRLINYLAIGSGFAIILSIISLIILLLNLSPANILVSAMFYYDFGIIFSVSAFLWGLTYKNRKELIERIKEQEALKLVVEKKGFENAIALIKAKQDERNRISADIHDDLGAGMTAIRLYSELAKAKLQSTPILEIEKISASANELLNKMNAIIWSISSSNDTLGNLVAYIRSYTLEYFENSGINCTINLPEDIPNIIFNGEVRRNIFLVIKEALTNILKHAKATEVIITLQKVPDGLKLLIYDNGIGIDLEKLRQFGNGLSNMKKRMQDVNINFLIENKNGTLLTLHAVLSN